ncbi:MAG: tetratricopeptide repeat protein [Acidobacteria bacterium]|nr:tetratricopeptide repeat protein [Acidobacteriota bacterium]
MKSIVCWAALSIVLPAGATLAGPDQDDRPRLHTPAQIIDIMEKSHLVYEVGDYEPTGVPPQKGRVLTSDIRLVKNDEGGYALTQFTISKEASELFAKAEAAYEKKDYAAAMALYLVVQEKEPEYHHLKTLMGDVEFMQKRYPEAEKLYLAAIESNFADYEAHWFLSDAYAKQEEKEKAVRSLTIAHVLNVNHEILRKKLVSERESAGRPWKEWSFSPEYSIAKEGDKIKVKATLDWMGYAITKAVWAYEPGYAEAMDGPETSTHPFRMDEEKEALLMLIAMKSKAADVEKVIADGYVDEFAYYEILAPQSPEAVVLMPREIFMRIVDYVDKYH